MKKNAYFFCALTLFASCKESKEDLIARKWQAISLESPMLDKQIAEERRFIDTVGTNTDAATNERLYGVRNMDSMRQWMHAQMDSFVYTQQQTIQNTWLDFNKNGTVAANFGTEPDTVSWYFNEEGALMLDEMKHTGSGSKIKMDVVKLEKELLQLRFEENGYSSTATFKPVK
jgi:hypothetical protein